MSISNNFPLWPYVCFACRRSFKRRLNSDLTCPRCGGIAIRMSRKFKPPPSNDAKQWKTVEYLFQHGFRYESFFDAKRGKAVQYPKRLSEAPSFVARIHALRKAAQKTCPAQHYEKAKDYRELLNRFRESAEKGDAGSQTALGRMHEEGRGHKHDYCEAAKWYKKAADQGERVAEYHLAQFYLQGKGGVGRNVEKALMFFRKSAQAGYPPAQTALGLMYEKGNGVKQNDFEAATWYTKAADFLDPAAEFYLAQLYLQGKGGVGRNVEKALMLFRKSAQARFVPAQKYLKKNNYKW